MSRAIHLDNSAEQTVTIENLSFGRVRLSESSETGSTAIEMTRAEALDLAMALVSMTRSKP